MSSRSSILVAFTNVLRSVLLLGPVGRFGPPQPLREVSMRKPSVEGNPAATKAASMAAA